MKGKGGMVCVCATAGSGKCRNVSPSVSSECPVSFVVWKKAVPVQLFEEYGNFRDLNAGGKRLMSTVLNSI